MADATGISEIEKEIMSASSRRWRPRAMPLLDRGMGARREIRGGTQSGRREQRSRPKTPGFLAAAHVFKALFSVSNASYACRR